MNNTLFRLLLLFTIYSPQIFCSEKQPIIAAHTVFPGDTLDVIIGITNSSHHAVDELRAKLSLIEKITVMAYCQNLNAFVVRSTGNYYSSAQQVYEACQKAVINDYKLFLKEGTLKELLSQCTTSPNDDPAKLKELIR